MVDGELNSCNFKSTKRKNRNTVSCSKKKKNGEESVSSLTYIFQFVIITYIKVLLDREGVDIPYLVYFFIKYPVSFNYFVKYPYNDEIYDNISCLQDVSVSCIDKFLPSVFHVPYFFPKNPRILITPNKGPIKSKTCTQAW